MLSRTEASGDWVLDFSSSAGDRLQFVGYGSPADGATFVQLDSHHWSINSAGGAVQDILTVGNGFTFGAADYTFI